MQKLLVLALALAGCSAPPEPVAKPAPAFMAKRYDLPDGAYLQTVSLPGRYVPTTCVIYTNEKLGKTHMACEVGTAALEGPEQ